MLVRSARILFTVAVILLLLGGLAIVVVQVAGLVAGAGEWLTVATTALETPTFIAAGVAGVLAFLLSYQRRPADRTSAQAAAPHQPRHVGG